MMFIMGGPDRRHRRENAGSWRRGLTMSGFYNFGRQYDNTDGPFAVPATLNPFYEWGPSAFDRTAQCQLLDHERRVAQLQRAVFIGGSSAPPLTIRTGFDDNGDLIFNDRPDGVSRNSARTKGQWNSSTNFNYAFTLGNKQVTSGGGVQISGGPGGLTVNPTGMQTQPRYRLNLGVDIQNLFNHAVYSGYSGAMNSQFFLQPTRADGVRRIRFNTNISF